MEYKLGDTIKLKVGNRVSDGYVLDQSNSYNHEEDGLYEELQISGEREFTVVGFADRLAYEIEGFSAPGYSILTRLDEKQNNTNISLYINLKNSAKVYDFVDELLEQDQIDSFAYNDSVLRYQGISNIDGFTSVLYGLVAIILILIMVGGIALIYNSFSISISERSKQFGLLSSVGATRK